MLFGDIEKSKRLAFNVERIFPVNRVRYVIAKGEDQELSADGRRRDSRKDARQRRELYAMSREDVVTLSRRSQEAAALEDYSSLKPRVIGSPPEPTPKSSGDETEEEDFIVRLTPDQTHNH